MEAYFQKIEEDVEKTFKLAEEARKKGFDPESKVDIPLAKNMAERVEGLISAVAPQIKNSGMLNRILELEKLYHKLDWRVALTIGLEIAKQKFCSFKDEREAMEVGIRVALAYLTLGVVASPLEGFTELKIKKRKDGKKYFCLMFSGPIRSAGTTVTFGSILAADYIRKNMGYSSYDPTNEEIKRMVTELYDYHEKVSNLQYLPSEEEIIFIVSNLPMQIDGEPSEKYEVSNYKDLERIETNRIRNGPCLVIGESLTQKAAKAWAYCNKWIDEFSLEDWNFLVKFLKLQKEKKSKGVVEKHEKGIAPDYTYIKDLVAGRPVITHPLRTGGLRLRYGRSRVSGLASISIHPATMIIVNNFLATGTQLRYERPGKSSAIAQCDLIEGPIVKLNNGEVRFLNNEEEAENYSREIEEILFLGDVLINFGEFYNRAHVLVPAGYCEEWWIQEVEKAVIQKFEKLDLDQLTTFLDIQKEKLKSLFKNPLKTKISADEAINISKKLDTYLHPHYTYHWKDINKKQLQSLIEWIKKGKIEEDKIILPLIYDVEKDIYEEDPKRILELLGIPHLLVAKENVVIEKDYAKALIYSLNNLDLNLEKEDVLEILNEKVKLRDKSGTFIGARMGRPEKAKMRKLTGSPQVLFPVGSEGGRLRCFQAALEKGKIKAQFPIYHCSKCNKNTIYYICEVCGEKCKKIGFCEDCRREFESEECPEHGSLVKFNLQDLDIEHYFKSALKILNTKDYPQLIKGVRGTSNKDHIPEHLVKGILRAKHHLYVNKDGTIRYDVTEMPITHFKPKEIGVGIEKLKELGYEKDIEGNDLENAEQLVEIKPQDILLPACPESVEEGADEILFRTTKFIDELFEKLYCSDKFYRLNKKEDLVGHLIIGLAPHTSAAIIGRIIGFTKTQGLFAHPLWHSAMRRDCLTYNTNIPIYNGNNWQIVKIGDFVENLKPDRVVDNFGTLGKKVKNLSTISLNKDINELELTPIKEFTKHKSTKIIRIKLETGRNIEMTHDHKFFIFNKKKIIEKRASELIKGEQLIIPYNLKLKSNFLKEINLLNYFKNRDDLMVRKVKNFVKKIIKKFGFKDILNILKIKKHDLSNYLDRDSFPITFLVKLFKLDAKSLKDLPQEIKIGVKRNFISINPKIPLNKDLLETIGLYIAEGYSRKKIGKKSYYQVAFLPCDHLLNQKIKTTIKKYFNLKPYETKEGLTYSSRLLYEFFVEVLKIGSGAKEKRIPSLFLNLPEDQIRYLLRGYFEGDGSVSLTDLRVTADSANEDLINDLEFLFSRLGIFIRKQKYKKEPGPKLKEFYIKKRKKIPKFESTKLIIPSNFCKAYQEKIGFISNKKNKILKEVLNKTIPRGMECEHDNKFAYPKIKEIIHLNKQTTYCLEVNPHHNFLANGILVHNCEGDETSIMLLMDALLNFSRQYLPAHRGATQDAPLVITSRLIPAEVDDMVFDLDLVWKYPLELYEAAQNYTNPREVKFIEQLSSRLGQDTQYYNFGFTHDTFDLNSGVRCSAYKSIPTMQDKVRGQMEIAEKIRAVDEADVARLIIERHFIRDIKGNLRKFSMQNFRCVNCNESYRRPPLEGRCLKCGGHIIFTIAEGSIIKYLEPSIELAKKYDLPPYLKQSLELTKRRIESVFGKEPEKQEGLIKWFGK